MSEKEEGNVEIVRVEDVKEVATLPKGISFFDAYIPYHTKETLEIGGEAYLAKANGKAAGLFLYDDYEQTGTIFTHRREVFDRFYGMKPFDYIFSELETEHEHEIYDIFSGNLKQPVTHRFSHEIAMARDIPEIQRFMDRSYPNLNKKWVRVAVKNGERCFVVRIHGEIVGIGWVSLTEGIGRLHSTYVKPQFRRMHINEDLTFARILWLKSKHAYTVISEISRSNHATSKVDLHASMGVCGEIYMYPNRSTNKL